jgi:hypothetical protein
MLMRLFYVKQGNQVNKDEKILTVNMENTQNPEIEKDLITQANGKNVLFKLNE